MYRTSISNGELGRPPGNHTPAADLTYPPGWLVGLGMLLVLASVLMLGLPDGPVHWIGYAVSAGGMTAVTVAYRHVDLQRRRSAMYVPRRAVGQTMTGLLLLGVLVATVHAFLAMRHWEVA